MNDIRKAAEQALEALELFCECGTMDRPIERREALRQALAQPKQEPVDWEAVAADQAMTIAMMKVESKREWVGLTQEEVDALLWKLSVGAVDEDVRTIEAKLKEKNT